MFLNWINHKVYVDLSLIMSNYESRQTNIPKYDKNIFFL